MLVFLLLKAMGSEDGHLPTFWLLLQKKKQEPALRQVSSHVSYFLHTIIHTQIITLR